MSSEPAVLRSLSDGVCTLTLNRPEAKNSLSVELVGALHDALAAAIADDDTRVVVLTNAGNTFCAGADLKATRPGVGDQGGPTFVDVFKLIQASPTPIVGRIDGHATGGGVGLVAACDLSVMRDDAKIGFTEVRLGVAPAVISVVCLPKMRRSDASELFLTGRRFTPGHAADVGLINRAVAAEELDVVVDGWVGELVRGGPTALGAAKDLITRIPEMDDDAAFEWTAVRSQELFDGPEAQAGIAAFRERTDAPWVPETFRS
ncbi:MAG: enoyl-CoA hydratase/isomerase family protein [Acidimicrobiales bacterium]